MSASFEYRNLAGTNSTYYAQWRKSNVGHTQSGSIGGD
jgi:hypothetical protein